MIKIKLGQIVQVLCGREAGSSAVVIAIEGPKFVRIADGKKYSVDKPKKKNVKHIQPTYSVGTQALGNHMKNGVFTNEDLRSDLNQYLSCKKGKQKEE